MAQKSVLNHFEQKKHYTYRLYKRVKPEKRTDTVRTNAADIMRSSVKLSTRLSWGKLELSLEFSAVSAIKNSLKVA